MMRRKFRSKVAVFDLHRADLQTSRLIAAAAAAVAPVDDFESDKQRKRDSDRVIDERSFSTSVFFFPFLGIQILAKFDPKNSKITSPPKTVSI
jgi:hypothetical protein